MEPESSALPATPNLVRHTRAASTMFLRDGTTSDHWRVLSPQSLRALNAQSQGQQCCRCSEWHERTVMQEQRELPPAASVPKNGEVRFAPLQTQKPLQSNPPETRLNINCSKSRASHCL